MNPIGKDTISLYLPESLKLKFKMYSEQQHLTFKQIFEQAFQAALNHDYENKCYLLIEELFA